jgi:hypothetical protein
MFSFLAVQTGRELSEVEVNQVNLIIKKRARRSIASPMEEWLYPERHVPTDHWRKLDDRYLLMPDPRSVGFTSSFFFGNSETGMAGGFDAYGHPRGHPEFDAKLRHDREWWTWLAFQGEYARLFGPKRRGQSSMMGDRLEPEEDDPEFHNGNLDQERYMPRNFKKRRDLRAVEK